MEKISLTDILESPCLGIRTCTGTSTLRQGNEEEDQEAPALIMHEKRRKANKQEKRLVLL